MIELGHRLLPDVYLPAAHQDQDRKGDQAADGKNGPRPRNFETGDSRCCSCMSWNRPRPAASGCWDAGVPLRDLLERELPWRPTDQKKAVRLLGCNPTDALDRPQVARLYLAGHVLLGQGEQPFQAVIDDLPAEERPRYESYLKAR